MAGAPEASDGGALRAASLRERRLERQKLLHDRRWREDEREYSRRWLEDERVYNRGQSQRWYFFFTMFVVAATALLFMLAWAKVQREWRSFGADAQSRVIPEKAASQPMYDSGGAAPIPPVVLLVGSLRSGEASDKPNDRSGTPVVAPEVFSKLMEKLFDGGTVAVSSAGDLTRKFAEAGIRISEDGAKQVLAAILRPSQARAVAASSPPSGPGSIQLFLNCGAPQGAAPPVKRPPAAHPIARCTAPAAGSTPD